MANMAESKIEYVFYTMKVKEEKNSKSAGCYDV